MGQVFILHPLMASHKLQAGDPSTGEDSEKARANLVYCSK